MTVSAKKMMERLSPAERDAVAKRAAELIAEEMKLRSLREAFALTQEQVAARMGVGQETISRIEGAERDIRLSTLKKYVEALGGELELVARFPERTVRVVDPSPARQR